MIHPVDDLGNSQISSQNNRENKRIGRDPAASIWWGLGGWTEQLRHQSHLPD